LPAPIFNKRRRFVAILSNQPDSQHGGVARAANSVVHRVPDGSLAFAGILAKAELAFMLPGFRFLFAAIVLSMSILVFGLGAAALLRAAHEQFASIPSRPAPPGPVFAQAREVTAPVLAMLRVETPAAAKPADDAAAPPATATNDQAATISPPVEPERTAALKPEETPQADAAKPEAAVAEVQPSGQTTPAPAIAPAPTEETKVAAIEPAAAPSTEQAPPPAVEATPVAPEITIVTPDPATVIASTKIATLGGPPVTIETKPPAKVTEEKSEKSAVKKRQQARRALERRKAAARARLALQPAQALAADPFPQPTPATRGR
jgi:hypothetical protein